MSDKKSVFERAKELTPYGSEMKFFWENVTNILEQDLKEMVQCKFAEIDSLAKEFKKEVEE